MAQIFNIYCDESCHLENDRQPIMVLGAVWCPFEKVKEITTRIREIKIKNGLSKDFEVKWTKVSGSKKELYLDILDYFFDDDDLHFRVLVAPKTNLKHEQHGQTHDDWYYKMYWNLLKALFSPNSQYNIYLDIKDSRGRIKVAKLHNVLCSSIYDFSTSIVKKVQIMRSHESELMQLADMLIGIISYVNRGLSGNEGKVKLVNRMRDRSGYSLLRTTLYKEEKVNIFHWSPQ